jgi:hypothetical protein
VYGLRRSMGRTREIFSFFSFTVDGMVGARVISHVNSVAPSDIACSCVVRLRAFCYSRGLRHGITDINDAHHFAWLNSLARVRVDISRVCQHKKGENICIETTRRIEIVGKTGLKTKWRRQSPLYILEAFITVVETSCEHPAFPRVTSNDSRTEYKSPISPPVSFCLSVLYS